MGGAQARYQPGLGASAACCMYKAVDGELPAR